MVEASKNETSPHHHHCGTGTVTFTAACTYVPSQRCAVQLLSRPAARRRSGRRAVHSRLLRWDTTKCLQEATAEQQQQSRRQEARALRTGPDPRAATCTQNSLPRMPCRLLAAPPVIRRPELLLVASPCNAVEIVC